MTPKVNFWERVLTGQLGVLRQQAEKIVPKTAIVEHNLRRHVGSTIVIHVDNDGTVRPRHGERVIKAVLGSGNAAHWQDVPGGCPRTKKGTSTNGRHYSRSTYHANSGNAMLEHWLVHGAGHAWCDAHALGSYIDTSGPEPTAEMLWVFRVNPRT